MIVTKEGLKHSETKEKFTWEKTFTAKPTAPAKDVNDHSWTSDCEGWTVMSGSIYAAITGKAFSSETTYDAFSYGGYITLEKPFTITVKNDFIIKVTVGINHTKGEITFTVSAAPSGEIGTLLLVTRWEIDLSLTFDADYAYLDVKEGFINIGGDLSIGGSLTVPSNKGIIVNNLQGGSIKINQVTGGEIDIDSLKGGEINIDELNGGEITISDITPSSKSIIDLSKIYLGDEDDSDLGPSAKNLKLTPKWVNNRISYVLCDKGYLYVICALLTIGGTVGQHSGLLYIDPDRDEGKLSASMVQGGWYTNDSTNHFQIIVEPCDDDGNLTEGCKWESSKGMRMYLHRISCSYSEDPEKQAQTYTETVNGDSESAQNWRVWKLPVKFNVSGYADIE